MKENAASTSDLKRKAKMDSEGSSKHENVVHIDDEETEPDSSSESSSESEFTTCSDDTDDDNSDDEDFDIHEVEDDEEDSDEDADELEVEEESGDSEDSDAVIALPKPKKAMAKEAKVEVKEKIIIIDLEKELKETVAPKKKVSKKNIITEPAHQTLSDDSDDSIAFPENQNVDVEEQSTFDSLEDIVEVESIPPKKNSNSNIVGESAHQALSHNHSEDGDVLPTKQNSSTADVEVQAKRTSVDLDEKKLEAEKTSKRKRVREQAIQAPATKKSSTKNIGCKSSAHQALSDDSNDGIEFAQNKKASADAEVEERTVVSLEDVLEVETVTATESSNRNVVGESAHQGLGDGSEDGIALPTKQNAGNDVEVIAKTTSVDLEEEEKIEVEKTSKRKRVSEVAFQAPDKSEKKNPTPYSSTEKVTRVESGSTRSVEQKTEKKTYRTRLLDTKNNAPGSGKDSAYQTPPVCAEAEFHSLSKNEKKKRIGTRAVRIETKNHSPLKNGKVGDCRTSPVRDEAAFHSLSDDDARTGDVGVDNDVEDDDLGIDDLSEVDNAVNDEDVDAYDYLLDDDIYVAEKEDGDLGGKRVQSPKIDPLFKLFLNTIWEKGEGIEKEREVVEVATSIPEPVNIYKFNYGVEKRLPKEKSDYEIEMDQLWAEYEFALRSCELDAAAPSTVNEEQQIVTDGFTSCGVGKHQLILDEEIGIRCMFCSLVKREIRHILPAFGTPCARERPSRILSPDDPEFCMFDSFRLQATGGDKDSNVHPSGTVWDKFPAIKENLYPHQIEGFEFLWRNLAGGINLDGKNKKPPHGIGGCIISHAPGTGKTLLTIAFLRSYMEIFRDCRPVLIAPSSMLLTWEEEFKKWKVDIAFHNISSVDFSGREDVAARKLVKNKRDAKFNRLVKILSWSRGNGVLGVSYQLFEKLTADRTGGNKEDKESEEIRRILLKKPNLIILDEGHTPRNTSSNIFKCLKNVKTDRRVILSGTPFQNNFDELFNTLWLVRPEFADKISSKRNQTRKKKSKALESGEQSREIWASFTSSIGKNSDVGVAEIRRIIEPFVNVHTGSILQKKLPGLRECVVVLHPTDLQRQLLDEIIKRIRNSFEVERAVALTSVHPSLLIKCSLAKQSNHQKCVVNTLIKKNQCIKEDAFRLNYHEGVKTRFLMQLIKLSDAMNEKVLVFSQFRHPIALIEEYLHSAYGWRMGEEILQMDGSLDVNKRQALITRFNDPESQVKVMLASIKACGEGISLIGASRIVMLDVVWNPSVTKQAISRAYRLGQKKVVYTYHLITSETSEENKYCRQAHKDQLSQQIFFAEQGKTENPDNNSSKVSSDDKILEAMLENNEQKDMFKKIIYQPKESILLETFGAVPSRLA
ncbi:hypothetical protein MKW98_000135 [Papaver atlanticum]|uniref:Uncharacterized protein n=1 Tax=Papaver atlanticum TaxID=357466 RepID=A0AAD4SRE1_9MAGN|nr:hypothetical protein MKW98_000135 [Papaver atlanticum]